jgi:CheY-like chemotaxis protein
MPYVLAIEPDQTQADILRDSVSTHAKAPLTVVGSLSDAIAAINQALPDLVLVSPLMSSDDERQLVDRLRDLHEQPAPQILVTPSLAAPDDAALSKRSFFSRRRRRALPLPCDPQAFADDLSAYLPDTPPLARRVVRMPIRRAAAERREAVRFERVDLARVLVDGAAVDVVDVSLTGAQVLGIRVLRPGASVHVLLARRSDAICCNADVVWGGIDIVGSAQELSYRAGIRFSSPDRDALERLYFGVHEMGALPWGSLKGNANGDRELRPRG